MAAEQRISEDVEFWPLPRVMAAVGLSRSEIYRQMGLGQFPASRSYRNCASRKFWVSTEVRRWQAEEIGILPVPDDAAGLIG
jgi:predicted DNA-binding transcriptional regulator AlpA